MIFLLAVNTVNNLDFGNDYFASEHEQNESYAAVLFILLGHSCKVILRYKALAKLNALLMVD